MSEESTKTDQTQSPELSDTVPTQNPDLSDTVSTQTPELFDTVSIQRSELSITDPTVTGPAATTADQPIERQDPSPPPETSALPSESNIETEQTGSAIEKQPSEEPPQVEMELASDPPAHIAAGSQLRWPLVVLLRSTKSKAAAPNALSRQNQSFGGVWAFVSLMSADGSTSLAPPHPELLLGQPVASIRSLPDVQGQESSAFAYASFPGLAIALPGRYLFKINVVDMHSAHMGSTARVLKPLHTDTFDVVDEMNPAEAAAAESIVAKAFARLEEIGLTI
ncbi:uncharacterized protein AB675_2894 [Cyphellophora attinorum]|uniref:Velvet domain-containing protein n=1 Tax=Cyphellophora attinorum TaxID=1664694 RepID=A0A0N1H3T0_9EURO|nr:uncharacterized protein AB675_2894 [Phialophora attinorum]KPI36424.1 hypothetical protein AB675_2894 [Phialophora attinorum]